jgi:hypothetical protein
MSKRNMGPKDFVIKIKKQNTTNDVYYIKTIAKQLTKSGKTELDWTSVINEATHYDYGTAKRIVSRLTNSGSFPDSQFVVFKHNIIINGSTEQKHTVQPAKKPAPTPKPTPPKPQEFLARTFRYHTQATVLNNRIKEALKPSFPNAIIAITAEPDTLFIEVATNIGYVTYAYNPAQNVINTMLTPQQQPISLNDIQKFTYLIDKGYTALTKLK